MKKKKDESVSTESLLQTIVAGIEEVKGQDILILDLRHIEAAIADYFVIATATNTTQVEAIAKRVEEFTRKELGEKPRHVEGVRNAQWVLMDYFSIITHIFHEPVRGHYDLEGLWSDAKEVKLKAKKTKKKEDE